MTWRVRRALRWSAILFPCAAVVAALFVHGWPAQRFLLFYVAPLFLAAPLWAELRIGESGFALTRRSLMDGAITVAAFLRFVLGTILPFSGHMLFLTYTGITTPQRWYRWLALALIVETTAFKLWLWRDRYSWSLGLLIGIVAAAAIRLRPSRPAI
jgi:hypothetical protein